MVRIGVDCESYKVLPGLLTPRMVCLTWSTKDTKNLLDRKDGIDFMRKALQDPEVELVGHRISYDLALCANEEPRLLPYIFEKLEQGKIMDTMIRQQLIDIATGEFKYFELDGKKIKNHHSLAQYVKRYFQRDLAKGADSWQLRFDELDGVPLHEWPEDAANYALMDAVFAREVSEEQDNLCGGPIPTENLQMRSAFALHLMSVWGIRTNRARVDAARETWLLERSELERKIKALGFVREDGTRNTTLIRQLVKEAYEKMNKPVPMSDSGKNVSTDKDALLDSNDPNLKLISEYVHVDKYIGTYLPVLVAASEQPFNPAWKVLVRSGRTSCGGGDEEEDGIGNLQNLPQKGPIRECYIPRDGRDYCSTDLDTAELRSLAEVCLELGFPSVLAEELNAGLDPHKAFAAELMTLSYQQYEEVLGKGDLEAKDSRRYAKVANFGFPGGLGSESFVSYARGFGIELSETRAKQLHRSWKKHYIEMTKYFAHVSRVSNRPDGRAVHPITKFVRGDVTYTGLANHYFQHLTACGAKEGLYQITKECYTGKSSDGEYDGAKKKSPLFNSRPTFFVHDEVVTEVPKNRGHEAGYRQAHLMVTGANCYIKRVKNTCKPALMTALYKDAKETFDSNGRLIPWTP